jgi:hypothetical protein
MDLSHIVVDLGQWETATAVGNRTGNINAGCRSRLFTKHRRSSHFFSSVGLTRDFILIARRSGFGLEIQGKTKNRKRNQARFPNVVDARRELQSCNSRPACRGSEGRNPSCPNQHSSRRPDECLSPNRLIYDFSSLIYDRLQMGVTQETFGIDLINVFRA